MKDLQKQQMFQEIYATCRSIVDHKLHQIERILLLHHSKADFRDEIKLALKSGLNTFGSELNIYDNKDGSYRLLLKGVNYIITKDSVTLKSSGEELPNDRISDLLMIAKKKLEAFDSKLRDLDDKAKKDDCTEYSIADVLDDYKHTCDIWASYKKDYNYAMPKLYENTQKRDYCSRLLNLRLGRIEEEKNDKLKDADLSILILLILGVLPKYGTSPRSYDATKSSEDLEAFMEEYYSKVGKNTQCVTLFNYREFKSGNILNLTKFSLIVLLRDFIAEVKNFCVPIETIKKVDKVINEHEDFNNRYDIEGVWKDEDGAYWSISNREIWYFMYRFVLEGNGSIRYQRFKFIVDSENERMYLFDLSSEMDLLGGKCALKLDWADYKLTSYKKTKKNQQFVERIELTSLYKKYFKYKRLERVDDNRKENLIKMWKTHHHHINADMFYCSTMLLNTLRYIYLGSDEKDEVGRRKFFYKIDKGALLGKDGFSVSFDWSVCLLKAIWYEPYSEKYYIVIEKADRYFYVDENLDVCITKTNEEETKIVQQLLDMDYPNINKEEENFVEKSNYPFSYDE